VKWILATIVLLVGIQLVPVSRTNPPVETEIPAPPAVREILRRACYDCHSHETRWPWYSRVAPVSWLVAHDVFEGRRHLNLSAWNRYDAEKRRKKLDELWEQVDEGDMPLWFYVPLHPEARLSEADREALHRFSEAARGAGS